MSKLSIYIALFIAVGIAAFSACNPTNDNKTQPEAPTYFNLHDTVKYVGMTQCRQCHQDIYNSFIQTGMGQSIDVASRQKTAADFTDHPVVYDQHSDLSYYPFWEGDSFKIKEFRLTGKDTIHTRIETVDHIIGSGQHTNSHLNNVNGYLFQMPLTFYTQKKKWQLPPGFENGSNTRFSRKISLECMTCHNSYPVFVKGSENKYASLPNGINCERCHGPGEYHVKEKIAGHRIDTSKFIDPTIVNPGKLPIDLQFDVCQRCHLQGNAVLKEGKSFFDFKPGMKLSDVISVFVPQYSGGENEFIMASHVERLKLSKCFIQSAKNKDHEALRPYKSAMTCVTCHNPHVSVKVTGSETFNNACRNCHYKKDQLPCKEDLLVRKKTNDNCSSCHMPKSGTIDIPHVSSTDHYIRVPVKEEKVAELKSFVKLYSVNEEKPDYITEVKAYLQHYEKFDPNNKILFRQLKERVDKLNTRKKEELKLWINFHYLQNNFKLIAETIAGLGVNAVLNQLNSFSYDNSDGWALYRIGECFYNLGDTQESLSFFEKSVTLVPYNYEFQNKLGSSLFNLGKVYEAKQKFENIIKQNPGFAPSISNLGYIHFIQGDKIKAEELYIKALSFDPDYVQALYNYSRLLAETGRISQAKTMLNRILKIEPDNSNVKQLIKSL